MKRELTFIQAFSVLEALEQVFTQKLEGSKAIKFYKLSKPLRTLIEDYKELVSKVSGEEGSEEREKNIEQINNSIFDSFNTILLSDLEGINISPSIILKLEPLLFEPDNPSTQTIE